MSNVIPGDIQEKIVTVSVPLKVQDDDEPKLSADLDARGHDLLNVRDLQCATINGTDPLKAALSAIRADNVIAEGKFAPKAHSHPEISAIPALIDQKIAAAAPNVEYALKDHTHPVSVTPLSLVERGQRLKEIADMDVCPMGHTHPKVDEAIAGLNGSVADLKATVGDLLPKTAHYALLQDIKDLESYYDGKLAALAAVPAPAVEPVELTGCKYCLVTYKCASRTLRDMLAVDFDGNAITAAVTCKGRSVSTGQKFSAGDLFVLPPNCLVLFRFA